MKKTFLILVIYSFFLTRMCAQTLPIREILNSVENDEKYRANQRLELFTKGLTYHVPYIKKIEARFGVNGNALQDTLYGNIRNEDFYGLLISPNSLREIREQKRLKTAQINSYEAEKNLLRQNALFERYLALVPLIFAPQLRHERKLLDSFFQQKYLVVQKMLEQGIDIKIKDVMDTENDRNLLRLVLLELENGVINNEMKIRQFVNNQNFQVIDFQNIISIAQIENWLNMQVINTLAHPSLAFRAAETALADANFRVENAQNRQIFNFVQISYENPILILEAPQKQKSVNNFSVRLGLSVPIVANNNLKKSESLLKAKEAQEIEQIMKNLNKKAIDLQIVKLKNLLKQYRFCEERINENLIQKMLKNEKLMLQITPLEIIDLKITQQKLNIRKVEISQDVMNEYIRLLELSGTLGRLPLQNFLSPNFETLSN
jgi:hypothetical protein